MKKIIKTLIIVITLTLITGCGKETKKEIPKLNEKMNIGTKENEINGYTASIRILGIYNNENINESIKVKNYMNNNYEVTTYDIENMDSKTNTEYVIGNKNYKYDGEKYKETKENIKYSTIHKYLNHINEIKEISKELEEEIGNNKYKTYEYKIDKKEMKEILIDTKIKEIELIKEVPVKVWIDSNGYIYKIEFRINEAIEQERTLELNIYYSGINQAQAAQISFDDINL